MNVTALTISLDPIVLSLWLIDNKKTDLEVELRSINDPQHNNQITKKEKSWKQEVNPQKQTEIQ